jgi:microcompartment protein CcmL/EutN
MTGRSIGMVELTSIAAGYLAADTMLKAGDVELVLARSICSGKYMVLVAGELGAVQASVEAGAEAASGCLVAELVLPNVHDGVLRALGPSSLEAEQQGSLGILESFHVAALLEAADAAAKAADVSLREIRLAMALGGKAFATMTGDVGAVQAAVAAGRQVLSEAGVLVEAVVIPRPHSDLQREIV